MLDNFFLLKHDIDGTNKVKGYDYGITFYPYLNKSISHELNYNDNDDGSLISIMKNWKISSVKIPLELNIGLGICIHSGYLDNIDNKTEYGSRFLFKENIGIKYNKLELFLWHISNADLAKKNEGNTSLGIKYYK